MDIQGETTGTRRGILAGVKVLDLTRVLAGPYASMILADMGAEVVKVEMPGRGDDSRAFPPFKQGQSMYYGQVNRNKKSLVLDLKSPQGKAVFKQLVPHFDIVLENFRPGVMQHLGLDYAVLEKLNPGLIYGAVSGFGQTGPYSQRAGYDIIAQAMSGLMSVTGWPEGEPTRTGPAMADILGGLNLATGVLAALFNRQRTGHGDLVDISLLDCSFSAMDILPQLYFVDGQIPQRLGNFYPTNYPYDSFRARNGSYVIGAGNDKLFAAVCGVLGRPELAQDERFCTDARRAEHHAALKAIIEDWSSQRDTAQIVASLTEAGVPAGEIYTVDQAVVDPHLAQARNMVVTVDDPQMGETRLTGTTFKFKYGQSSVRHLAPRLGQDTDQVLEEFLGKNAAELGLKK